MPRTLQLSILDCVGVSKPCTASWEGMKGTDRVRHCAQCDLNVYNLAAMSVEEAENLIRAREGRLCGRIFRRADGTFLTADCPVGLARFRQRAASFILRGAAAVVTVLTATFLSRARATDADLESMEPFATLCRWVRPTPPVTSGPMLMGEICVNPVPVPPSPRTDSPSAP
ncbi:hypothetical protein PHYC_02364 [Phycisphaerales bacterium]|nr:hypothetical protein PHYC_02364 [Phycisphaerales bacterium]